MTPEQTIEAIRVMQAYVDNKEVECQIPNGCWAKAMTPSWDWLNGKYRIKPTAHPEGNSANHFGMTLRDYFAAAALNGLLANTEFRVDADTEGEIPIAIARHAYESADAMLKAREAK